MGTTATGLPYPEPTDPIAGGADAIRALAEAIDLRQWSENWISIAPATGWANTNAVVQLTRDGRYCMARGTYDRSGAAVPAGAVTCATLPVGYRPQLWYRCVLATPTAGYYTARMQIDPAGLCTLSVPTQLGSGSYFHWDGVMFRTAAP